jgi:hypothetical protein
MPPTRRSITYPLRVQTDIGHTIRDAKGMYIAAFYDVNMAHDFCRWANEKGRQ